MMTQKTISLTNEAYEKLAKLKKKKESFSQLILRLSEKENPGDIESFAGIWKDNDEWDEIEKEIYVARLAPLEQPEQFD
jgi:predicted CopG family antitoxin